MEKVKRPKEPGKILVNGREMLFERFKPHKIYEDEIEHAIELIGDIPNAIKNHGVDPIEAVRGSPLFHIEGLTRYQLVKFGKKEGQSLEKILQEPGDICHTSLSYGYESTKIPFLVDFLKKIVYISHFPISIKDSDLEIIKHHLRSLSFLIEPQLPGRQKSDDRGFKTFIYNVWVALGKNPNEPCSKIWDAAVKYIRDDDSQLPCIDIDYLDKIEKICHFTLSENSWIGHKNNIRYTYTASLKLNRKDNLCIEVIRDPKPERKGLPKSKDQLQKIWKGMRSEFIKNQK